MTLDDLIRYGDVDIAIVEGKVCMGFKPGDDLDMLWEYYLGDTVDECVRAVLSSICPQ